MAPTGNPRDPPREGAEAGADPLLDFFYREGEAAPGLPRVGKDRLPGSGAMQGRRQFVAFRLGTEEYAVAIDRVREILKAPVLTEVPRAPAHVAGVILVRGEVVAVQDPRRRLGLPGAPGPAARVIVCEGAGERVGLLVDGVSQVLRLLPAEIEDRAQGIAGVDANYIAGVGREGQRLVVLLDVEALIDGADHPAPEGRGR